MAAVGATLIAMGGGGFHSNLSTVEALDCWVEGEQSWRGVAPMRSFRHALAVQELDDWVYAIGGWVNGSECSATVERYNLRTNEWQDCRPLLQARRLHGAAALSSLKQILVFGGNTKDGDWYTASVEAYDTLTDEWYPLSDLPHPGPCSAVEASGVVFVFMHGGHVLRYEVEEDRYTKLSKLPLKAWYCFDVVAVGRHVYLIGGALAGRWTKSFYKYDTDTDDWTVMPDLLRERRRCAAAVIIAP